MKAVAAIPGKAKMYVANWWKVDKEDEHKDLLYIKLQRLSTKTQIIVIL